jgi:putative acetyltransferase
VRPSGRGAGLGRLLTETLVKEARLAGYRRVLLDTLPAMTEAQALYRSMGFVEIPAYCHNPIAGTRYMALSFRP